MTLEHGMERQGRVARDSMSAARWTLVSRVTGFARAIIVAAVLGPTFFGNTFQAVNTLPNLTFEFLTGSMLATLLVPALVGHGDLGRTADLERVAGGFLGVALLGFSAVAVLGVIAGPLVLGVLTSGVTDPAVADAQRSVGMTLLVLLMPQVVLYGVAGIGGAVMNARGRFGMPAAAPIAENAGVIATMGAYAAIFGTGASVQSVDTPELLLLGIGTTASVALHAGLQWWGARAVGVRLIPRAGWKDGEVRLLLRRAVPSIGYSSLNALRVFAVMVPANRVAGGVVAFSLALNFMYLPTALGARPVALAMLPGWARMYQAGALERFRDEWVRGLGLVCFLTLPAATLYLVLATPLARAASFGELATSAGVQLVAAGVAGLAVGVIGEAVFVLATHASYAREDTAGPLTAMIVRTLVSLAGFGIAFSLDAGPAVLLALGMAISAGNLVSAGWLVGRIAHMLPAAGRGVLAPLARAGAAAAAMVLPARLVASAIPAESGGNAGSLLAMGLATVVAGATYLLVERALHSPELDFFVRRG
jgi:putative peptidoglycan lipid II flippase